MCYVRIAQSRHFKIRPKTIDLSTRNKPHKLCSYSRTVNRLNFNISKIGRLVPLRGEKISSHAHKTGSWFLLGVLLKIYDEHPRLFYMGVPPGSMRPDLHA